MPIYLIRHGETALNAARVLQMPDTPLSALGLAQAEAAGLRLRAVGDIGAGVLVSSDMQRAMQTAQAIARHTGLSLRTSPLLRERDFGELRGLPYDSLPGNVIEMEEAPPGGESLPAMRERANAAMAWLRSLLPASGGPLLAVSHGAFMRTLLLQLHPSHPQLSPAMRLGNTSVNVLGAQPPHQLQLLNCTAHLGAALQEGSQHLSGG